MLIYWTNLRASEWFLPKQPDTITGVMLTSKEKEKRKEKRKIKNQRGVKRTL